MKKIVLTLALLVSSGIAAADVVAEDVQAVCASCSVEAVDLSWLTADEKAKYDALESTEEKAKFLEDAKIARAVKAVATEEVVVDENQEINS